MANSIVTSIWSWAPSVGPPRLHGPPYGGPLLTWKWFKLKQSVTPFFHSKFYGKSNGDIHLEWSFCILHFACTLPRLPNVTLTLPVSPTTSTCNPMLPTPSSCCPHHPNVTYILPLSPTPSPCHQQPSHTQWEIFREDRVQIQLTNVRNP